LPALVLAMLAAAGLGFLRPGIALAATPTVEMVSVNTSDLVPAGDLCSFDVTFTGTGTVTIRTALSYQHEPKRPKTPRERLYIPQSSSRLDPQARLDTWELIEKTRDRGTTVILVTHYMEEAQRLCDRLGCKLSTQSAEEPRFGMASMGFLVTAQAPM
jgi:hypothetical protein